MHLLCSNVAQSYTFCSHFAPKEQPKSKGNPPQQHTQQGPNKPFVQRDTTRLFLQQQPLLHSSDRSPAGRGFDARSRNQQQPHHGRQLDQGSFHPISQQPQAPHNQAGPFSSSYYFYRRSRVNHAVSNKRNDLPGPVVIAASGTADQALRSLSFTMRILDRNVQCHVSS